ncbi:MAG: hypothetical protein AB7O24_10760 [Kofleriaceae bacterium]
MAYTRFLVAIALAVGCRSEEARQLPRPSPSDAPAATPPTVPLQVHRFEEPKLKLPSLVTFSLLEPGKQPAEPLRYALAPGESIQRSKMTLTSRRLANGTWGKQEAMPPIEHTLGATVTSADQPIVIRGQPAKIVGAATPEATQYLEALKPFEGRDLTVPFDARGQLGELRFADDPTTARSQPAVDELAQRLLAVIVPVPDEPVGIGAKWRVVTILRQRPAVVKQTATYTLVARSKTAWKIGVEISRVGEPQTLIDPAIPPDTIVELVALVRMFKGTLDVNPTRPLATGNLDVTSSLHIHITRRNEGRSEEIVEDTSRAVLTAR